MMTKNTQVGSRIKQLREAAGLTLTDLAKHAGVSRGYLYLVEKGESNPTSEKLAAIADALDVLVSEIFGDLSDELPLDIPESLQEFAEQNNLSDADVRMLRSINYRGKHPQTAIEWGILYTVIKNTLDRE